MEMELGLPLVCGDDSFPHFMGLGAHSHGFSSILAVSAQGTLRISELLPLHCFPPLDRLEFSSWGLGEG